MMADSAVQTKRSTYITLAVMATILLGTGVYVLQVWQTDSESEIERPRPLQEMTAAGAYTTIEGEVVSLETNEADLTIVTTWASWCPVCNEHLARVQSVVDGFPEYSIRTLAFNRNDSPALIRQFLQQHPLPDGMKLVSDPNDSLFSTIDGRTMPETVLLNRDGEQVTHLRNTPVTAVLRTEIERALNEAQ